MKLGDLVGVGWQRNSCHNCDYCISGQENLCDKNEATCAGGNKGGFAHKWRGDSRFCFKIPKGLNPQVVGYHYYYYNYN